MDHQEQTPKMGWGRLAAMIIVSSAIMFVLMYQLVYSVDHALFSLNRLLASLVMGCVMTAVMLGFMWPMYQGRTLKPAIFVSALLLGAILLLVNRSQSLVGDATFMRAMIPHHSIAVNNARKAKLSDPRVRRLADRIIQDQMTEIAEMDLLLADIARNGERGDRPLPAAPALVPRQNEQQIRDTVQ